MSAAALDPARTRRDTWLLPAELSAEYLSVPLRFVPQKVSWATVRLYLTSRPLLPQRDTACPILYQIALTINHFTFNITLDVIPRSPDCIQSRTIRGIPHP